MKNILDECGLSYIWNTHTFYSTNWLYFSVKHNLIDQFRQTWHDIVQNSSKTFNYRIYKEDLDLEYYLKALGDKNIKTLCRFRTLNMKLPVETGRWQNIDRQNRTCQLCDNGDLGDEFHYIMICPFFANTRKEHIKNQHSPNILKFKKLMNSKKNCQISIACVHLYE